MSERKRLDVPLARVRAGDIELACLDAGDGPPLVCIHGWPQHSWCWRRLAARLVERYRVIAPDLRGFGDSPIAASGFDKKTLAGDVAALIETLDVSPCVVVGHDWGAPIAYRLALDFPKHVRALVIMNGRMPLVASHTSLIYEPRLSAERWYFHFNRLPDLPETLIGAAMRPFFDYMLTHWSAGERVFDDEDLDEIVRVNARPDGLKAGLGLYRTAMEADAAHWREHEGARIEVPNLVLWGTRDPVLTVDYLEGLEIITPDLEIHRNDAAGHFVQEQAPAWCAERMFDFLGRHTWRGAG